MDSHKSVRYTKNSDSDLANIPLLNREPAVPVHISSRSGSPPLARLEETEELEPKMTTNTNSGIDDGLLDNDDTEVETIPRNDVNPPPLKPRENGDRKPIPDNNRPTNPVQPNPAPPTYGPFPYAPGFGPHYMDAEPGYLPSGEKIPDVNVYQHKKTLAQGMMDLALFSANANQLRYVLESYSEHPYYYLNLFMIIVSLLMQVAVGAGLIWNSRYNVKDQQEICVANRVNNLTVIGIFVVTMVNVFISAFGVARV